MLVRRAALAVGLLILLAGCDSSSPHLSPPEPVTPDGPTVHHVLAGASVDGGSYTLDLLSGATTVQVRAADLDGHLYRVETPAGTTVYPSVQVSASHTVAVTLQGSGDAHVTIELDQDAAWQIRFSAGMSTASVDMATSTLRGFSALAGVSTLDLTAGRPAGDVLLTETAGVSTWAIHLPAATAVTVHADAGAGNVSLYGESHQGVAAGTSFSSEAGAGAGSGSGSGNYTVQAEGGVSSLVVDSP